MYFLPFVFSLLWPSSSSSSGLLVGRESWGGFLGSLAIVCVCVVFAVLVVVFAVRSSGLEIPGYLHLPGTFFSRGR